MAHKDICSLKSSEFGDEFRPEVLSYDELGSDCQYLILREADPVKFKNTSKAKKKGSLNTLKDLQRKKRKLMKALNKNPQLTEQRNVEIIDLTLDSDEENKIVSLAPQNQMLQAQLPKMQKEEKIKVPEKQIQTPISPDSPLRKEFPQKYKISDIFEGESDTTETCNCKHSRRRKRKKIQREKYEIESSDSYTSKQRLRKSKPKIREVSKINNVMRLRRNLESPSKYKYDRSSLKAFHDVEEAFGDFFCRVCNIEVHSEVTLQTHLVGRKHLRALKAQAIPEVARESLKQFSSKPSSIISCDEDENQLLHYPLTAPGMTRIKVKKVAKLQTVAESYRKQPVTGLTYVTEIHLSNEVVYYCELCDSSCAPNIIMIHLIGFKHKLNFFKLKFPIMYERFQYKHKRYIENEMMKILVDYDKTHGRGFIKVEKEVDELLVRKRRRSYSSHRRNCGCSSCSEVHVLGGYNNKERNVADSLVTDDLDMSLNDFHCKVCDSHMNNEQMWEAHIRGRRHIKNKKKGPGENPAKIKNILCPGERPILMNELFEIQEPVVGLNYIHEVQGRAGNQYKCFLCGACCTSFDIIEHIISEKHRMKLLEAENKRGKKNGIEIILNLSPGLSPSSREKLVAQEAAVFQRDYGKGRMSVYKSKDFFPAYH